MEAKEIQARLEIVKLATTIGDHDVISLQIEALKKVRSSKLNEIIALLAGKNYRQALYLIKNYLSEIGANSEHSVFEAGEETERVLDIEDMLKMSPLAKDTIKDYKRSIYTDDDLAAFAKNIEKPIKQEYEQEIDSIQESESKNSFIKEIEEEAKENIKAKAQVSEKVELDEKEVQEVNSAIDEANKDTPLDEISAEVLNTKPKKSSKAKSFLKYKKIREKFARKDAKDESSEEKGLKSSTIAKSVLGKVKKDKFADSKDNVQNEDSSSVSFNNLKEEEKSASKESKEINSKIDSETIYAPIPHIEQKFRQAFILYPPVKESESWTEEVVKFLKHIAKNSFTERDVKVLLDDYHFYLEKNDIAKAAQILLLASSTESQYAKFILARELFTGKIIVRDLKKSFDLMKSLANNFYPEAVCDLAQFYEYGIGVPKDKSVAIKLYEKAFQLGVSRATKHINRLKESNSFFSTIFKIK